jgi:hypothetical protein
MQWRLHRTGEDALNVREKLGKQLCTVITKSSKSCFEVLIPEEVFTYVISNVIFYRGGVFAKGDVWPGDVILR